MLFCVNAIANSVPLRISRPYKYRVERAEIVTLAKAGVQHSRFQRDWIPASAGMTKSSLSAVILTRGADDRPESGRNRRHHSRTTAGTFSSCEACSAQEFLRFGRRNVD